MTVALRVQPRAGRNALVRTPQGAWKLYLTSPAAEGRANQALTEFFSRRLRIAKSRVRILSGEKSRHKLVVLEGIAEAALLRICEAG